MRKKIITALSVMLLTTIAYSQEEIAKVKKNYFSSGIYAGILEGEAGSALQLQIINGINRGNWFGGIGTGLDYYRFRSVPVFLTMTRYLKPGFRGLYLQGDAGINFPWVPALFDPEGSNDIFRPGLYWNGALGYATCIGKKQNGLLLSLGYSYKKLSQNTEQPVWCINPPCPSMKEEFDLRFRRLSLRIGWQFMTTD